jgi:hypothetical protein
MTDEQFLKWLYSDIDEAIDFEYKKECKRRMSRMNKLKKLHTEVKKLEEYYEDCSAKAMEKNNIQAMMVYSAKANAFTRVRWMIETIMEVEL